MNTIRIGNKVIGQGYPCFIVAEISANHHQNFEEAVDLIRAAASCGVDAIKLQTYTPDTITINSDKKWFIVGGKDNPNLWKGKTFYQLYQTAYTPWEWQPKLKKIAEDLGLILFSTPFDETAVDFLETMDVPCYKVASYEVNHIPLLKKIAQTKKPVIMSVGYTTLEDVILAVETLRDNGAEDVALLHCVTFYSDEPSLEDMNLQMIQDMRERFGAISGFSDNNGGIEAPVIAASLGASIIEKHFILNRRSGGPDAKFSIEPNEMRMMVERIWKKEKSVSRERALGTVHYGPANATEEYNRRFCRSIFVVKDMRRGDTFTKENIRIIRPADGLPPKFLDLIISKTASCDIEYGTPLVLEHIVESIHGK